MIPSIRNIFITAVASISLVGFDASANQIIPAGRILVPASKNQLGKSECPDGTRWAGAGYCQVLDNSRMIPARYQERMLNQRLCPTSLSRSALSWRTWAGSGYCRFR